MTGQGVERLAGLLPTELGLAKKMDTPVRKVGCGNRYSNEESGPWEVGTRSVKMMMSKLAG